jgi:glycosyltransferase involved in cell wall biosynthesis
MLRILALEPYYGGSHKAFLDGYRGHSRHRVELLTMPARKWKWRMRGAAVTLGREVARRSGTFDLLLASDYVDLAALAGMQSAALSGIPLVAYFHENQLTYPLPSENERDYQFGFTNLTTCLAADRVLFNSRYHLESFLEASKGLLRRMPDLVPDWAPDAIRERAEVVPVGVDLEEIDRQRPALPARSTRQAPLTVLWNHRWEYDKGAETFFGAMMELAQEGHEYWLSVTGQGFREAPAVFEQARVRLAPKIKNYGYVESRAEYVRLLLDSDLVVSTAVQEFFGIAVVEAVYAGCLPLLPAALSYPELLPESCHQMCLYAGRDELKARLAYWLRHPQEARSADLSGQMERFGWPSVAPVLDGVMERLCGGGRR